MFDWWLMRQSFTVFLSVSHCLFTNNMLSILFTLIYFRSYFIEGTKLNFIYI
jgi:hypothetical protein